VTGPDVVPEQTVRDLGTVLRPLGPVDRVELVAGGMFATTYRATLGDGTRVVVKTAPTDTDRLLRYEHDLLRTEAAVYALAAGRPDLLMPRVLLTDLSRTVLPSDVLVVSHLDGVPLVDAGELEPAVTDRVQRELGAFMARLHTVHGERFGCPNLDAGLHAATWTEAFESMVEALLDGYAAAGGTFGLSTASGGPGSSCTACTCPSCCSSRSRRAATWATGSQPTVRRPRRTCALHSTPWRRRDTLHSRGPCASPSPSSPRRLRCDGIR
jgi:hypothetical protein